jgi:hypothetical protein
MRIGRTILAFVVTLSLATLPMARAFVAPGDEAVASEAVAASARHDCDHEAMRSDVVVSSAHECCHHDAMPSDHAMKGCPLSADCIAKCSSFYAVLFSEEAIPSAIGGTEPQFVSKPFYSRTASPPFRPPRA